MEPPDSIPNSEVKRCSADDSYWATGRENKSSPRLSILNKDSPKEIWDFFVAIFCNFTSKTLKSCYRILIAKEDGMDVLKLLVAICFSNLILDIVLVLVLVGTWYTVTRPWLQRWINDVRRDFNSLGGPFDG